MGDTLYINPQMSIPLHEIEISASRAGGPGGQHVNKTSSKITVRWNLNQSMALSEEQKSHLRARLSSALTTDGDLIINNSSSRSQIQNKKLALDQLVSKIRSALYVPKKRLKASIPKGAKESRLKMKKVRSEIKKMRGKKDFYD